jgi:uncharacterized protein (DUF1697 family)
MSRPDFYVALLRGINVGGKHKLPMKALVEIFSNCKCSEVRTFIQSGNVVFTAPADAAAKLPALLAKKIEEQFGFAVPVLLRSRDELARALRANPFLRGGLAESALYVYFLADRPSAQAVKLLDPQRFAPDEFRIVGREIYLHLPHGMARTKLTNAYFDAKLSTVCTARNWATAQKLLEMMGSN